MWSDRLAEVWAAPRQAGAGAALTADIVITARHVVAGALDGGTVLARIVRPGVRVAEWVPMRIVAEDVDWDVALLQVEPGAAGDATATLWDPPSSPVPSVVRLGTSAEPGCETVGFPRSAVQRAPSGAPLPTVRQSEQAIGTLLPGGQGKTPVNPDRPLPSRWMPFDVTTAAPEAQAGWSGMSGAAVVLPDGRLVGVVVAAESGYQARRLYVVPLADVLDRSPRIAAQLGAAVEVRDAPLHRRLLTRISLEADGSPRLIGEIEGLATFGVKPADVPGEPPYLRYVERDADGELSAAFEDAAASHRVLLMVGGAASGKSRSLAEAVRARWPDRRLLDPVEGALPELAAVRCGPGVVWLDDVHRHAAGIAFRDALEALLADGAPVVATIRRAELDRLAPAGDVRDPAGEALTDPRLVRRVDWQVGWSETERARAAEAVAAGAARDALGRGVPLGVWAIAGPALLQRLRDAEHDDDWPANYWLVRTVLAWYRTGVLEPMPADLASELLAAVSGLDPPPDDDEFTQALDWATRPVIGDGRRTRQSLLQRSPAGALTVHDYVLDQDDVWGQIPTPVWEAVVRHLGDTDDKRLKVALVAFVSNMNEIAIRAVEPAAEAGNPYAMWLLGKVLEQHDPVAAQMWFERGASAGSVEAMVEFGVRLGVERADEARRWFERAAAAGSVEAMGNLAVLLWTTEQATAVSWLERAAEAGSVEAMDALGNVLADTDPARAREWWQRSASAGFTRSEFNLGVLAERTDGDLDAARQHYRRAAEAGYGNAAYNLGNLLWPSEPEAAVQWLERAAELGVTTANVKLAGILGDSNPAEARRLLQAAAVAGDGDAMLALAYNTYIGALPGDDSDVRRWLEQAVRAGVPDAQELYDELYAVDPGELRRRAADGDVQAMYNLGTLLADEDREAARAWLARAAQRGYILAMNNLASMLLPEHPEEARMWLERAAATGEPTAIHNLAWLAGEGDDAARRWLELAAEAGEPRSMYELGEVLVSQNRDLGLAWLRRAAEAGDTFAMNSLGIAFAGDDPEEAERWFRRGAEAGYDKAMFNLASMLGDDRPAEARRWHLAAAESGHTGAMLAMAMYSMEEARADQAVQLEDGGTDSLFDLQRRLRDPLFGGREWVERAARAGDERAAELLASARQPQSPGLQAIDLGDGRPGRWAT
jgi:TPR repeat protein